MLTSWDEAKSNTFKLTVKATQAETALSDEIWPLGVGIRRFTKQKVNASNNNSRWQVRGRNAETQNGFPQNRNTAQQLNKPVFQGNRNGFNSTQNTQKNQKGMTHLSKEAVMHPSQLNDRRIWLRQKSGRK